MKKLQDSFLWDRSSTRRTSSTYLHTSLHASEEEAALIQLEVRFFCRHTSTLRCVLAYHEYFGGHRTTAGAMAAVKPIQQRTRIASQLRIVNMMSVPGLCFKLLFGSKYMLLPGTPSTLYHYQVCRMCRM